MSEQTRTVLKTYFETGDTPTEAQFIDLIDSLLNLTDDDSDDLSEGSTNLFYTTARAALKEQIIYIPTTQPAIATDTLTTDLASYRQAIFEPRLSVGTRTINIDFNWLITNDTNNLLFAATLSLTGTIVITFESDVLCSNASSIGVWDSGTHELTLATGTDDIIEFQFLKDSTSGNWLLKVSEVAA